MRKQAQEVLAMGVPKRKPGKSHRKSRRAQDRISAPAKYQCPNCLEITAPHRACVHCGYYKGRKILNIGE